MKVAPYFLLAGMAGLLALAGCGRSMLQTGDRAAWREQAEVNCMQSGAVKVGAGVVQLSPIEGPGMCGANFPLKVAALGTSSAIGYGDDVRPPGGIPNGSMPRWPVNQTSYSPSAPAQGQMRWVPGPPGIAPGSANAPAGQPMSISPPGVVGSPEEDDEQQADDIPDDAVVPGRGPSAPRTQPAYNAPPQRAPPPLGPARGPRTTGAIMPAVVTPPATLSCPIVSALERWVTGGLQPAALHWFGVPVAEIKQISAYSCRGMVGAGTSRISEHAFGNALDIAGFVLADGRKIMIKNAWRGSPEEQGFLHDVQLFACQTFNTVLAPGYNAAHYDHFHLDLMRRSSGRRPCRPEAIRGEVVAAKARAVYASRQRGPAYTGSIASKPGGMQTAIPGEDGFFDDEALIDAFAKSAMKNAAATAGAAEDDDTTGSIGWPRLAPPPKPAARKSTSVEDRMSAPY